MKNINKLSIFLSIFAGILFFANFVSAQYYLGLCTYHHHQQCVGNSLYWYDSCGNQQDIAQYCSNGCYNNSCQNYNNNYNNYNICTYHAYKLCSGNNIYWYNSCGSQEDLFQSCLGTNLICQYGQCVYQQPVIKINTYVAHYKLSCYANSIYWYDSVGNASGLYKNCNDGNSCTLDSCAARQCSNILKCDGSTCAAGSPDFNNHCSNNSTTTAINTTPVIAATSVSFFARQDQNSVQWQKTVGLYSDGQVYFMATILNSSKTQVNNINISANIPAEITSLGNLKLDGVQISGDIVSGVNVGSLASGTAKSITFEGKAQSILAQATKQAIITTNILGVTQTDSISINLIPGQVAGASVSSANTSTSGFLTFLKRWYLWILVGLVLIFLFFVVFKRLSSDA